MNESQFRALLDKYVQGTCTPEEIKLLHRFYDSFQEEELEEEPDAFEMWLIQEKIHRSIERSLEQTEREEHNARKYQISKKYSLLRAAAIIFIFFGIGIGGYYAYDNMPEPQMAWVEKITKKGQKATLTLTDGTKVYLNVDSKLTFPERFDTDKREVVLEGEAFFDVTKNPEKPFIIRSGNLTTTVLGTSFNIKAFDHEDPQVTVVSGKVKVNALNTDSTHNEVLLTPFQQAFYDGQLHKKEVEIRPFIAWRDKVIHFDEVSLEEAVVVLERWFNVSIDIEGEQIRKCKISGKYLNENLINIMKSFEHILDVEYTIDAERKLTIKGEKGCKSQN
ncbi:FecR domain-containing protein [Catalinimonas sp. 4WD22]|uniref:FecR family protein n=1 Tax=Catalinimonas locisalis TaxID=3133978 RepID=UPI00310170AE